jgi:ATP/maltotriose-dependent transcriptional regulator MalT
MQFDDALTEGDSDMQKIVNRLSMVFTDDYTTELMIAENEEYQEHLEHLAAKEQLAEQKEQLAAQMKKNAEQHAILMEKEQELAQQKSELAQQKKQLDEKDKQIAETDALLSASIKMLASAGISNEQIAQKLNISVEKVEALMAS